VRRAPPPFDGQRWLTGKRRFGGLRWLDDSAGPFDDRAERLHLGQRRPVGPPLRGRHPMSRASAPCQRTPSLRHGKAPTPSQGSLEHARHFRPDPCTTAPRAFEKQGIVVQQTCLCLAPRSLHLARDVAQRPRSSQGDGLISPLHPARCDIRRTGKVGPSRHGDRRSEACDRGLHCGRSIGRSERPAGRQRRLDGTLRPGRSRFGLRRRARALTARSRPRQGEAASSDGEHDVARPELKAPTPRRREKTPLRLSPGRQERVQHHHHAGLGSTSNANARPYT
jgi:hypothetical protein